MSTLRFDELTREELREMAPRATALVPLGSTEQHGPDLPVCTDTAIVSALAANAAAQASRHVPVIVTPTLPFGFAHHHLRFGATISIDLTTYTDVITNIGCSLAISGFRRIIYLNGHGGNDASVRQVGDRLVTEHGLDVHVAGTSYWHCAADTLTALRQDVGPTPGHAGGFETSCMLALHADLVRGERTPSPDSEVRPLARMAMAGAEVRRPNVWEDSGGRTDDACRATVDAGERILNGVSQRVAEFIVEFHRAAESDAVVSDTGATSVTAHADTDRHVV